MGTGRKLCPISSLLFAALAASLLMGCGAGFQGTYIASEPDARIAVKSLDEGATTTGEFLAAWPRLNRDLNDGTWAIVRAMSFGSPGNEVDRFWIGPVTVRHLMPDAPQKQVRVVAGHTESNQAEAAANQTISEMRAEALENSMNSGDRKQISYSEVWKVTFRNGILESVQELKTRPTGTLGGN